MLILIFSLLKTSFEFHSLGLLYCFDDVIMSDCIKALFSTISGEVCVGKGFLHADSTLRLLNPSTSKSSA